MSPSGKKDVPDVGSDESIDDLLALDESQALANDEDLEKSERRADYSRRESFKTHLHRAILILFWLAFGVLLVAGFLWTFHMFTPVSWHFLTDNQVSEIKTTFMTGVLSSSLATVVKNKYVK